MKHTHERAVEQFYSHGAEHYGQFHDGYLNFGLWEEGIDSYVQAAENLVLRIGDLLRLRPECRLLDVACGMGSQDICLFNRFGPLQIDAVDVTWKHIELGTQRARKNNCDAFVRFHHGSATSLPFFEGAFTHVVSVEGAVHFNTRERFFHEAFRILAPGGVIALADYTLRRKPQNGWEKLILEAIGVLWKVPADNRDSAEDYLNKLKQAGFEKGEIREVGKFTFPGYYFEQRRPECRRELARIRGFIAGRLGRIIDEVAFKAYTMGLVEYVLVSAEKGA